MLRFIDLHRKNKIGYNFSQVNKLHLSKRFLKSHWNLFHSESLEINVQLQIASVIVMETSEGQTAIRTFCVPSLATEETLAFTFDLL